MYHLTFTNEGLIYLCLLGLELFDDSEVETNDVLGEGDNKTLSYYYDSVRYLFIFLTSSRVTFE